MITVEPNLPPWRNEIDEEDDTAENELDDEFAAPEDAAMAPVPLFRWSARAAPKDSKPTPCRTLVVAFNHANEAVRRCCPPLSPSNWVGSIFVPGLSVRGNHLDPLHPENKGCQVFQVGPPGEGEGVFVVLCTLDLPPESLVPWADTLFAHLAPRQVVVLDGVSRLIKSYPSPWSHLWQTTYSRCHARTLHTASWTGKTPSKEDLPPMAVGRPVFGPTAAIMEHCQLNAIPAMAALFFIVPGPSRDLLTVLQPLWALMADTTAGALHVPEKDGAMEVCRGLMKKMGTSNDGELLYI